MSKNDKVVFIPVEGEVQEFYPETFDAAMSKLEQRWDRLWPLACRVAHAVERYDGLARDDWTSMVALLDLTHAARALRRAVDELSPEESDR